jgi:hypothetical protein
VTISQSELLKTLDEMLLIFDEIVVNNCNLSLYCVCSSQLGTEVVEVVGNKIKTKFANIVSFRLVSA